MRRLRFLMPALCAALLTTLTAWAHPPAEGVKPLPPTKAAADLMQARLLMDTAKNTLAAQGRYHCCMKPLAGAKSPGCDLCARTTGSCHCAANLKAGRGVCGQCVAGWKAGQGNVAGVKRAEVKLLASPSQGVPVAGAVLPAPPELAQARTLLNRAKRTLVAEGRWGCCVGQGGCDECAYEKSCPCAGELGEGDKGGGVCGSCLDGWAAGIGRLDGITLAEVRLAPPMTGMPEMAPMPQGGQNKDTMPGMKPGDKIPMPGMKQGGMDGMAGMHGGMMAMQGMTGNWSMMREASGTSWLPDTSPMYGKMTQTGRWQTMFHGYGFGVFTDQTGGRGDRKAFAATQIMGMASQRLCDGSLVGGRAMLSADPALVGVAGYPLLFQTGETAHGRPLVDRQHPHDLFMELAATYSKPLGKSGPTLLLYGGPVGEPALGPTAFMHRLSAIENPEAPLGHHWLDSTHITFGVATVGLATNAVKVEGSVFTGREPDENRWNFDRMRFDSYSGRVTWNPSRNLSGQISHGFLHSPEAQEVGVNQQRTTASLTHNLPLRGGADNLQTTLAWGRNRSYEAGATTRITDAYLLESSYLGRHNTVFGRIEHVGKDELFPGTGNHTDYPVTKYTLGGVHNIREQKGSELGVGGSVSFFGFPSALKGAYGSAPVGVNVFLRLRTGRM